MNEDNQNIIESLLPSIEEDTKVGIFGGSFNPPHLGHAMLALTVLMTQNIDEVWVIPCADHSEKDELEDFETRMKMCELTFGHISNIRVLPLENFLPKPNYTLNTLKSIKDLRPKADLHFLIGADLVEEIPDWANSEGLTDHCTFLIVPRQGYPLSKAPEELGNPIQVELGIDLPELSSTFIGQLRKRGVSIEGFVEKRVGSLLLPES